MEGVFSTSALWRSESVINSLFSEFLITCHYLFICVLSYSVYNCT